jgi:hypothetical protein
MMGKDRIKMGLMVMRGWQMATTGSGLHPAVDVGISVESLPCANIKLQNCIITCRNGRQHWDFVNLFSVTLSVEVFSQHLAMKSEYRQVHSFCSLSYGRSVASSKTNSPQGAI